jgi:hypothetical protein
VTRRIFTIATFVSLLLCAAAVALYFWSQDRTHLMQVHIGTFAIYARADSIGWRKVDAGGVHGWDFPYGTVILLTIVLPLVWAYLRLFPRTPAKAPPIGASPALLEELRIDKEIRFLLPPAMAIYCIIGLAALGFEARNKAVWVMVAPLELLLIANLRARRLLKTRLIRLRGKLCPQCGYSLTGNVSGLCPECGTPIAQQAVP